MNVKLRQNHPNALDLRIRNTFTLQRPLTTFCNITFPKGVKLTSIRTARDDKNVNLLGKY